jgi:hypothetical protein
MMPTMYIKPKSGVTLRDLSGAPVPAFGAAVEKNSYWARRIADKDAEKISEADFNKGKKAAEKALEADAKRRQEPTGKDTAPPAGA